MTSKAGDIAGVLAAIVLAVLCLSGAVQQFSVVSELKHRGISAPAVVVDIERGARNSKWAVYRYLVGDGREITARDTLQQYIISVNQGDSLTVIYARDDVRTVTADLGIWIWQGPAIFLGGFLLLVVLAIVLWRYRRGKQ